MGLRRIKKMCRAAAAGCGSRTVAKVGLAAIALVAADPIYVLWKALSCDVPDQVRAYEIPRDPQVKQVTRVMNTSGKSFVVVTGDPGVGKTTTVLSAARQRGSGVLYINGAKENTAEKVMEKIAKKYGSPLRPSSDHLGRAADWYFWLCKRQLVVIVDHLDRVEGAEELLHLAKEAADEGKLRFFFISVAQGIPELRKTTAFCTRSMELRMGPPSIQTVKTLLDKALPGSQAQWDDIVYWSGCNLSDVWLCIDALRVGYTVKQLKWDNPTGADADKEEKLTFWSRLLEAGPEGLELPDSPAKVAAIQSNRCCRIYKDRVYFKNGVCVDSFARLLKSQIPERKYGAFAGDVSEW